MKNSDHSRNHIVPAFIIKRFSVPQDYILKNFNPQRIKAQNPGSKSVLKLEKNLIDNLIITEKEYIYSNPQSDEFIKKEIYFLNENIINTFKKSGSETVKEYFDDVKKESLEKSYNPFEGEMSKIIDAIENRTFYFTDIDIDRILKYIESAHLRSMKFHNFNAFITPSNEMKEALMVAFISKLKEEHNQDESFSIIDNIIKMLIIKDFFINIFDLKDAGDYFKDNSFLTLMNLIVNKTKIPIEPQKGNLILIQNDSSIDFILGDNPVYTIYEPQNGSGSISFFNNIIECSEKIKKLTVMILSPKYAFILIDNEIFKNIITTKNSLLVKKINSLSLYNADEWIVTSKIISNKKEIIYDRFLKKIKIYDFFHAENQSLLSSLGYDIEFKSKSNEDMYKLVKRIEEINNFPILNEEKIHSNGEDWVLWEIINNDCYRASYAYNNTYKSIQIAFITTSILNWEFYTDLDLLIIKYLIFKLTLKYIKIENPVISQDFISDPIGFIDNFIELKFGTNVQEPFVVFNEIKLKKNIVAIGIKIIIQGFNVPS